MKRQIIQGAIVSAVALAISTGSVFAHVVVRPDEVGVAKYQTFNVSVPNEKDNPTVGLRLVIPSGVKSVTPTVKDGWTIKTQKDGDNVTEINWTGGSLPAERRDDFSFSAQAPSEETTIQWKAYQTYSDGTIVSWDQDTSKEGEETESENSGPLSQTKVVNDLEKNSSVQTPIEKSAFEKYSEWAAYGALLLAVIALALSMRGTGSNMQKQQ